MGFRDKGIKESRKGIHGEGMQLVGLRVGKPGNGRTGIGDSVTGYLKGGDSDIRGSE